jgi:hypothetical protein
MGTKCSRKGSCREQQEGEVCEQPIGTSVPTYFGFFKRGAWVVARRLLTI